MSVEQSNDMIREWKLYMYLLRCAIRGNKLDTEELSEYRDIESVNLRKRAEENGQGFLLDEYIYDYAVFRGEQAVKSNNIGRTIFEYERYKAIRNVLDTAAQNNVPLVVFKGCVLAGLYPEYIRRSSCDTDLFVDKKYKKNAVEMLLGLGYVINEEKSKDEVCVLRNDAHCHTIELHTCLWEDYEGRRLEILKSIKLTDNLININTCGLDVTTLGYEQHLIYQIFHIIKHFSLEGVSVKYMADITLYVDAYGKNIDFSSFWDKLAALKYDKFAYYLMAICAEFLGMDNAILNGREMAMGEELYEFMLDLFNVGAVGVDKRDNWQILGMMTPYFTGEKKASKGKTGRKLAVIFPRPQDMQASYTYAKKYPVLVPVAWGQRITDYLIKYIKKTGNIYSASEKLDKAEHRIDLMDKLGLLD